MDAIAANKKLIAGIAVVVGFLLAAYALSLFLKETTPEPELCAFEGTCPHEQELNFLYALIPMLVGISLLVGAGTYFLMSQKLESKEKSLKKNTDILLKFLNPDEKRVVNKLIEGNGKVLQAEISRIPELGKVKSHRIIQRLVDRRVIEVEGYGKTNIVKFTKEIKEGLL